MYVLMPFVVRAYDLTVPFPGQSGRVNGPAEYIRMLYTFGLALGALLAMARIVIGGIRYTLSEAVTSKEEAKATISHAIWGLVLLLAATLILFTVNPTLPNLSNPPDAGNLPPPGASTGPFAPPSLCLNQVLDAHEPCDPTASNGACDTGLTCGNDCRCHYGSGSR